MLAAFRKNRDDEGFTLIELLVVVIIIGILAAIAIPVFLNQRRKAWDSAAKSDLRNAAVIQESYFTDNATYGNEAALNSEGFGQSSKVEFEVVSFSTTDYCMRAWHLSNPTKIFYFDSATGEPDTVVCT